MGYTMGRVFVIPRCNEFAFVLNARRWVFSPSSLFVVTFGTLGFALDRIARAKNSKD